MVRLSPPGEPLGRVGPAVWSGGRALQAADRPVLPHVPRVPSRLPPAVPPDAPQQDEHEGEKGREHYLRRLARSTRPAWVLTSGPKKIAISLCVGSACIHAWCARSCAHHSAERAALCAALSAAVLPWNPWNPCRGRRATSPPSSGGETNSEASGHAPVGECTETWRSARRGASPTQGSGVLGCGASGCGRWGS